jgi:DNA-binding LacI/PurR family transcriptional regulator
MSNVTMSQVAEAAGVSQSTVSFVLNGRERANGSISPETKRRVQEAAEQLGYRPNRSARALVTGRSHLIGLCVRNLGMSHYANIIQRTEDQIRLSPFHLLISRWDSDFASPDNRLLEGLFPWPLDGVLALEAGEVLAKHWDEKQKWPAPIVSMGGTRYYMENLDSVGIDLPWGITQATKHLMEIGCGRIAFITSQAAPTPREQRAYAYETFMEEHRLQPELIAIDRQDRFTAHQQVKQYITQHGCPDGLLCVNDEVALGTYRALCELKINVPRDVALVGCDGIEDTLYLECPITTIVQPVEEMCRVAWEFLQQRIENPNLEVRHQLLMPELAVRDSSQFFGGNRK